MELFVVLLSAMMVFTGCEKRLDDTVQNDSVAASPMPVRADNPGSTGDTSSIPEIDEPKSIEELMEYYTSKDPSLMTRKRTLLGQIEGSFTGSGNKELIGFFQEQNISYPTQFIDTTYCFVFDPSGKSIETTYYLQYIALEFPAGEDAETYGLTEILGRNVFLDDTKIGYISDFNGNGKEELYLYLRSGMGDWPVCYEFDGNEFIDLLDVGTPVISIITSIDSEKKVFIIKEDYGDKLYDRTVSYAWNEETQRYEEIEPEGPDSIGK